ncbi:MAG: hypothetical protein WA139_01560 [Candidatus Aenigmatarchaeota archaeon]
MINIANNKSNGMENYFGMNMFGIMRDVNTILTHCNICSGEKEHEIEDRGAYDNFGGRSVRTTYSNKPVLRHEVIDSLTSLVTLCDIYPTELKDGAKLLNQYFDLCKSRNCKEAVNLTDEIKKYFSGKTEQIIKLEKEREEEIKNL